MFKHAPACRSSLVRLEPNSPSTRLLCTLNNRMQDWASRRQVNVPPFQNGSRNCRFQTWLPHRTTHGAPPQRPTWLGAAYPICHSILLSEHEHGGGWGWRQDQGHKKQGKTRRKGSCEETQVDDPACGQWASYAGGTNPGNQASLPSFLAKLHCPEHLTSKK